MPKQQYSEGRLCRNENGDWLGEWDVYVEVDGVRKRRPRSKIIRPRELKKDQAREKLREEVLRSRGQAPPVPAADSLTALWDRFEVFKSGNWSKKTAGGLKSIFKGEKGVFARKIADMKLGEIGLKSLTLDPLQSCLNAMARERRSSSEIKQARIYLKAMLEYAVDENMIPKNPARKLSLPTKIRKVNRPHYSLDEVHLLLSRATGREHLVLRILLVAGLRPAELFALRANDVRPGEINVDEALKMREPIEERIGEPKTPGSDDTVPIPPSLELELRHWIQANGITAKEWLFPTSAGTPYHPMNFLRRHLRPIIAKPGAKMNEKTGDWDEGDLLFDLDYRAMRRTCATYFRNNLTAAQRQLRHSTPMTTATHYRKGIPEEQRAAVEALDREFCPQPEVKASESVN